MTQQRRGLQSTPKVFNAQFQSSKPRFNWRATKSFLPALWLVLIVLAFILVPRLPLFRISEVQVLGTDDTNIIAALNQLKGQSIFSHAVQRVQSEMSNNFYVLKKVTCRRGIPNTLRCQVALRDPGMVWKSGENQFLVDTQGIVYSKIITLTDEDRQSLIYVEDKRNIGVQLGEMIANHEIIATMITANKLFKEKGYQVGSLSVDESFYQFTLNLTGAGDKTAFPAVKPLPVILTTSYSIDSQVAAVTQLLNTKSSEIKAQIDLRVQGYAYYK